MDSMEFSDLQVTENENYGVCEVTFDLILQNGLIERLRVGMVKVADFWIVYDVILSPDTPAAYRLVSTYQKINMLLDRLQYQDAKLAGLILELIKKESRDPNLIEYLLARVNSIAGNDTFSTQLLDDLKYRVEYSKLAVMYEQAMIHLSRNEYQKAVIIFEEIRMEYELEKAKQDRFAQSRSIFSGLPKDPFIASFSHDTVLADTYQNQALANYHMGEYKEGLENAKLAIDQADHIGSKSIRSSSMYVKALNLYKLKRFEKADKAFQDVISDLDNHNLSQKAWSYFYRGNIAARLNKQIQALDYFETAVNLDPFNYLIRLEAIKFLVKRNKTGDLEIALGLAIRGIQYDVEADRFKDMSAKIYQRLGLNDKSIAID